MHLRLTVRLLAAAAPFWWPQADPSPDEQSALEWINRARADPPGTLSALLAEAAADPVLAASAAGLAPETPASVLATLQSAYAAAQAGGAAFPRSSAISTAPLAFYPPFQAQASGLAATATWPPLTFPPGRTPPVFDPPVPITGAELLLQPGITAAATQAELYTADLTPREFVFSWLCAPGTGAPPPSFLIQGDSLPDLTLGHFRLAGVALARPDDSGARTLALYRQNSEFLGAADLPYGPAGTVFITGVAYRDLRRAGRYDPGDGIAGVAITLDRAPWAAVTATAGGYAIPVPANSGAYVVTATGGPFAGTQAIVTVAGDNVKLDWALPPPPPSLPPQVPVPPTDGQPRLINLSTRGLVETGANALIGGFVVSGPPAARKRLLLRGVGPSLATVGVTATECVAATQLQLFSASGPIAANTGWTTAADGGAAVAQAAQQCGAFPLLPWAGGGGDSALLATLAPGLYSLLVTPAPGAPAAQLTGHIGLVEIYDLSPDDGSTLINLSSRGAMGKGDAALIIGATIGGSGHLRLLARAAGPALSRFGLDAVLSNPALTVYDTSAVPVASDDDWSLSPQTDQLRTLAPTVGAFPFPEDSLDAALLTRLPPGRYTAIVDPATGTAATGATLVEFYALP